MADPKGFLKYKKELPEKRGIGERINDYQEFYKPFPPTKLIQQASRCMDCGVPFCHSACPLGNIIPEFNDAVYRENWREAYDILSSTNNFPEFTGRICPAPCEASCVLGINESPVTIENIEKNIIEKAFENNWLVPKTPVERKAQKVAVVGSGPAGLAAAEQLNQAGYWVTVFERDDKIGGLLRYGIPDFKLEKWVIDRRLALMEAAGIVFKTNANVGVNVSIQELNESFDAIVLCGGSTVPRDLPIEGRDLSGIHYAMDFLKPVNQWVAESKPAAINVKDKNVVIIGGGDTGADCVGTSNRQGAKSITQIELLSKPPNSRSEDNPWPEWPMTLRTSSSHEEGADREWALLTKAFLGDEKGQLKALKLVEVEWKKAGPHQRPKLVEIAESEKEIPCEAVFLAIGFVHPQIEGMVKELGLDLDDHHNVACLNYQTNIPKVFAAGDMRRGQSLVVWAINEGREAATAVEAFLTA